MSLVVESKRGEINNFYSRHIEGWVNYSNLNYYKAKAVSKEYSLKYVTRGTEYYTVNGKQHQVNAGQFLIVEPNKEIESHIDDDNTVQGVCIYFSKEIFEYELLKNNESNSLIPDFPICDSNPFVDLFFRNLTPKKIENNYDIILRNGLKSSINYIVKSNECLINLNVEKPSTQIDLWKKMEMSRQFIHNNFHKKLLLKDIAKSACLSVYHFQRIFKKFYNVSPSNYLFKIRIIKAIELLRDEKLEFNAIADQCGFQDKKYLKKCLKKFSIT